MRRRRSSKPSIVIPVIAVLVVVAVWGVIAYQWLNCSKSGGSFVRSVIWYECIKR